jgi:dihydroorotase/N-acyl-D-amino-acid deacylase
MLAERIAFTGATIFDGTGSDARQGSVLIEGGRIAAAGKIEIPAGCNTIDCAGLALAPGFIDIHSHSDLQVIERKPEKVLQGVTTEVVGNCGFSPYPMPDDASLLHSFADGILCGGGGSWGWTTARDYLEAAQSSNVHVLSLTGHGSLRIASAGNRQGALTAAQLDRMEGLLDDALAAGSCGFSTGLMYAPGSSAPVEELDRMCRVVARRGKVYATHIRDYAEHLVEAVEEQLGIARRTGCRLQISHMQAVGQRFWDRQQPALDAIGKARKEGVDVAFDCYPYVAGSTVLTQLLPQSALEGGLDAMLERLATPERALIADATDSGLAQTWADIYIAATASGRNVGRNLEEIGSERGVRPVDAAIDILLEERGAVNILEFNQSEDNLRQTLTHPLSIVISDGFYVEGRPHPRLHGTFPCLLGDIVRKRSWMPLAEAVRKITDAPAQRFGLRDRGRIAPGYAADLVLFDPERIGSPATYETPDVPPTGIHMVMREGSIEWFQEAGGRK